VFVCTIAHVCSRVAFQQSPLQGDENQHVTEQSTFALSLPPKRGSGSLSCDARIGRSLENEAAYAGDGLAVGGGGNHNVTTPPTTTIVKKTTHTIGRMKRDSNI
jgi:hypothetical protein